MEKTTTAILIFANSSQEEMKHKTISKGQKLFDNLNIATLQEVQKTRLPYYFITEKEQFGTSFGERLANAFQSVFDKGYNEVIAIGNDTPELKCKHLIKAASRVTKHSLVIGPSLDGGIYLVGISKENFRYSAFQDLEWKTQTLKDSIQEYAFTLGQKCYYLESLQDINTQEDLYKFIKSNTIQNSLKRLIRIVFNEVLSKRIFEIGMLCYNSVFIAYHFNKGSPQKIQS